MRIGRLELTALSDGDIQLPPEFYTGIDWSAHQDLLGADGQVTIPVGCFLVRDGERTVLLDAGLGPGEVVDASAGGLPAALREAGVAPGDIDTVVCTHLHLDHTGWLVVDDAPFFPHATVRFGLADQAHFAGHDAVAHVLEVLQSADRLDPIAGDTAIAPGVDALATPGHTPGHHGLVLSSGDERVVLLGDAVECPLQLDEPQLSVLSDVDPALARRTREALWRELEGTTAVVGAAHFPGLAFGRVLRGEGTRWRSLD